MSRLAEHYANEQTYAYFISSKRECFPRLLELVDIKTPWHIIEEVRDGSYENINEEVERSLAFDTLRIMAANLW